MYVPEAGKPPVIPRGEWSTVCPGDGIEYVTENDLDEYYVEYMKYPHKCEKCQGNMHVVQDDEDIKCPHCKVALEWKECMMWD